MQLFVYSALSAPARALLLAHLPAGVQPVFRLDLPQPEQQLAAFQAAEVVLGNVPPAWLTDHYPPGCSSGKSTRPVSSGTRPCT
ncbi:hypothetical protein [Hymenobacter cellulosilyticus]|uniref:hypothetical protein n=1 Tax=Hymenobacter cellulosilyticus TaxID=2932248 RepID=UPI002880B892|nr:hypothetical protein [Hymenobacter cellulosilyticus]